MARRKIWVGTVGAVVQVLRDGRWITGKVTYRKALRVAVQPFIGNQFLPGTMTVDVAEEKAGSLRLHKPSQVLYEQWKEKNL